MTRQRQKLPVKVHFKIPSTLASLLFPSNDIIISLFSEAQEIFGDYSKVTYKLKSYAQISPNTHIIYNNGTIKIDLYCVKNPHGVLQWGQI